MGSLPTIVQALSALLVSLPLHLGLLGSGQELQPTHSAVVAPALQTVQNRFEKEGGKKAELFGSKDPISWKSRSSALVVIVIVDVVTVVVLEICISAAVDEEFVVVVVFIVVVMVLVLVTVEVCVSVVVTVVLVTVVVVMVVVVTVLVVIVVVVVEVTYSLGQRLFGIFTNHWPCGSAMEALYAVPLLS